MPDKKPPKISAKVDAFRSPWMSVSEKTVDFGDGRPAENYYSVRVPDYVVIFAVTESGLIPIIRQYRPAVEQFTYEFPAGTIDKGETAEQACRRELLEETGLVATKVVNLGIGIPDSGRLQNRQHSFYVVTNNPGPAFKGEPGLEVEYWTRAQLNERILDGTFAHHLHLSVVLLAQLRIK